MKVGALGECMVELSGTPLERRYGGDTLNTAVYLARQLAERAQVYYLSALGDDQFSQQMCEAWQHEGVRTERVVRLAGRSPGLYLVETGEQGERSFHYWRNDSATRHWLASGVDFTQLFAGLDGLYLSGITLALLPDGELTRLLAALRLFKQGGGQLWFDNNYRPTLWAERSPKAAYIELYRLADIALITEDDERQVFADADSQALIDRIHGYGCGQVVVKRGDAACIVSIAGQRTELAPQPVGRVVDTCAAGDAFAAGYLTAQLAGHGCLDAIRAGHRLAGAVIQYPGAIMPIEHMPRV